MNEQNTYSAGAVKSKVIDFFISVFSNNFFIGNEVMYGTKRKLIDLLVVKDNQLTAIEIKRNGNSVAFAAHECRVLDRKSVV